MRGNGSACSMSVTTHPGRRGFALVERLLAALSDPARRERTDVGQHGRCDHDHIFQEVALAIRVQQRQPTHHESTHEPTHNSAPGDGPDTQQQVGTERSGARG